jgi:hypothetical protein
MLVNSSLSFGMPLLYKHAYIRPLLKKNGLDHEKLDHFRPVSSLPFLSKLIEKVVASQLINHLEINNMMDVYQSAYRRAHSCETALLSVFNDLISAIDSKQVAILTLIDLSAAFDTVDSSILSSTLHNVGVRGSAHSWLVHYLHLRSQSVVINSSVSSPQRVKYGVPQGSVLGPILFCVYLTGIGTIIRKYGFKYMLYADDVQIIASAHPSDVHAVVSQVQFCVSEIRDWLSARKLKMNEAKTEIMLVGSARLIHNILFPSQVLICGSFVTPAAEKVRDLGVLVDPNLSLSHHVARVTSSCFAYLRVIGKLRRSLPVHLRLTLIHSLVLSRINFCTSLLYGINKTLVRRLQTIMNVSIRVALGLKFGASVSLEQKKRGWLSAESLILFRTLCLIYKVLKSGKPVYLAELLRQYKPARQLRSSNLDLLDIPQMNSALGERAFSRFAPKIWNALTYDIRTSPSFNSFRSSLLDYLCASENGVL